MTLQNSRIKNSLLGLFVADALAMPAHWFYDRQLLEESFPDGFSEYHSPPHPHPESFMVGMSYRPDIEKAEALGRPYDILHDHAKFYQTTYSRLEIESSSREGSHGNSVPEESERYHYHHGLRPGDNTLGARLVGVLLRTVKDGSGYSEETFLNNFVAWMTNPNNRRDPYTEIYLRRWFENYCDGREPSLCAASQRDIWSIGSNGGLLRPLVLSLFEENPYKAVGVAIQHAQLTHRSQNLSSALSVLVPLLRDLLEGREAGEVVREAASKIHLAKMSGEELFAQYREHEGPGNIPSDEMWKFHTEFESEPFRVEDWVERSDAELTRRFGSACYVEQSLPLIFTLLLKYNFEPTKSLPADIKCGGDNVHRAMIHGLLLGATSAQFPTEWREGLNRIDWEELI